MYTVRYVVRASTLLPLSGPLSKRAIAVLVFIKLMGRDVIDRMCSMTTMINLCIKSQAFFSAMRKQLTAMGISLVPQAFGRKHKCKNEFTREIDPHCWTDFFWKEVFMALLSLLNMTVKHKLEIGFGNIINA
jgi:hypothetical protein